MDVSNVDFDAQYNGYYYYSYYGSYYDLFAEVTWNHHSKHIFKVTYIFGYISAGMYLSLTMITGCFDSLFKPASENDLLYAESLVEPSPSSTYQPTYTPEMP
eukprot:g6656.t1